MTLSLVIAFVSCFSIAGAKANNLLIVKFTPKFSIYLVIVIASINSFNRLTTYKYFFLLIIFFDLLVFASSIAVSWEKHRVKAETAIRVDIKIFFMGLYLLNLTFFGVT